MAWRGVQVRAFKESLGLSDEDAAPVHIEVGRRFMREGFETKDRGAAFEKRKVRQPPPWLVMQQVACSRRSPPRPRAAPARHTCGLCRPCMHAQVGR